MVSTSPSSRMTTPLPIRSVPRIPAVKASSGTSERKSTIESSAASRSKRNSSALGCISGGNAQLLRSGMGLPAKSRPAFYGRGRLRVSSRDGFPIHSPPRGPVMNIPISIAMASNPRTWPIFDGRAKPDGITLIPSSVHPSELFWRQLRFADFDVSEMSFSSLIMARSKGDDRWVGLPIFTTRKFFHAEILVRRDSGIDRPGDLKGRRVGVPEYQQTAALWTRGVLEHGFGVAPKDMQFWMERPPSHSHRGAIGFSPPPGVTINQIPPEKNIGSMMLSGELEAAIHYIVNPNLVDRSTADLWNHPAIKPLFPDPLAEGIRYYRKTGIFPINHGMVIRQEIVEKHPWIVLNLYKAFERANEIANRERQDHAAYHCAAGLLSEEAKEALAVPLVRHGIKANRKVLETAASYSHEQGLTSRRSGAAAAAVPTGTGAAETDTHLAPAHGARQN